MSLPKISKVIKLIYEDGSYTIIDIRPGAVSVHTWPNEGKAESSLTIPRHCIAVKVIKDNRGIYDGSTTT